MSTYRHALPQLSDRIFLTDGGIETTLIYHEGIELPHFAAFVLLDDDAGPAALRRYFEPYLRIAQDAGLGIVLESATWRASRDWGDLLGYSRAALADAERRGRRAPGRAAGRVRDGGVPGRAQWLHRPARRRLPAGVADDRRRRRRTTTPSRSPRSAPATPTSSPRSP